MKIYKVGNKIVAGMTDAEREHTSLCWKLNKNDIPLKRLSISLGHFNRKKDSGEIFIPCQNFQKVCEKALGLLAERKVKHIYIMSGQHRNISGYWLSQQYHTR